MLEPSSPRKFRLFAIIAAIALITLAVLFYQSLSGKTTIPDVTFTNLKGEKISAQSLRGKVVMVSTYNKYHADGLEYVAVAMSYDPANYVLNYVETRQLPFQVAIDADGQLAKAFGDVRMTPTTFVIDKQGNVLKRYLGEPSFDELHGLLEKALKA